MAWHAMPQGGTNMKKLVSLALTVCLCLALAVPAGASGTDHVSRHETMSAERLAYLSADGQLMMWEGNPCPRSDVVYCLWRQLA